MDTGLPRMLTSYESDAMASAAAASAAGGAGHVGAGPVGSGAAASSATAGGIGAAAAAASSGAGAGSSSSSASAGAKALGDLRRMYQLFLDVKTTVTWRGPGGGGAGAGASSGAASGVSARVRVVPPILLLRDVIKAHVVDRGCAIVVDPESKKNPVSFVQVRECMGRRGVADRSGAAERRVWTELFAAKRGLTTFHLNYRSPIVVRRSRCWTCATASRRWWTTPSAATRSSTARSRR